MSVALTVVDTALAQLGDPYIWGANGPNSFDCSGLVCYCWRAAGYRTGDYSADTMWDHFRLGQWRATKINSSSLLLPGDIVFYGAKSNNATHVVIGLTPHYVIGASGGSKSTDTVAEARAKGAEVRIDKIDYRGDRIGIYRPAYGG
jgi:cell wall-associated NlpC family hydrolase